MSHSSLCRVALNHKTFPSRLVDGSCGYPIAALQEFLGTVRKLPFKPLRYSERRGPVKRQSQLQIDGTIEGYDPTISIMHEGRNGSAAFISDLMEPDRPSVDRKVLEFIEGYVLDPDDFVIRSDGVCGLNPEMARCVAGFVSGGAEMTTSSGN